MIGPLLTQGFASVQVDREPHDLARPGLLPHCWPDVVHQRRGNRYVVVGARGGQKLRP